MENEKHVPDVDDYDDDNSLASLFLSLLCGALPGVTSPRQAGGTESCEKRRKKLRKTAAKFELCLERTSPALLTFRNKDCFCFAGLAGRPPRQDQRL